MYSLWPEIWVRYSCGNKYIPASISIGLQWWSWVGGKVFYFWR